MNARPTHWHSTPGSDDGGSPPIQPPLAQNLTTLVREEQRLLKLQEEILNTITDGDDSGHVLLDVLQQLRRVQRQLNETRARDAT